MNNKIFQNIPFFRILLPFLAGLIFCSFIQKFEFSMIMAVIALFCLFIVMFIKRQGYVIKILSLILADFFLFSFGYSLYRLNDHRQKTNHYSRWLIPEKKQHICAELISDGIHKDRYTRFRAEIKEVRNQDSVRAVCGEILLYLKNSKTVNELKCGDYLDLQQKFVLSEQPKNPEEFDQKKYLERKHVSHLLFADTSEFKKSERLPEPGIWNYGMAIRRSIIENIRQSGISENAFSIYAALITGYDEEIRSEVMDAFAKSGTLHVLSVSGLHTGILFLFISYLFDLVDPGRRYKYGRFFISVILLWAFALISGFAPPVLRAVIMFTLLSLGRMIYGIDSRQQLNILCVSAFLLLCLDPYLLWDIGFQLSYMALAGIFVLQEPLDVFLSQFSAIPKLIRTNVAATLSATLFTLPFTLFYFKQFPLWFIFSNLIIVPASFAALIAAVLLAAKLYFLAMPAEWLIKAMIFVNGLFSGNWGADSIDFNFTDACWLTAFSVFLYLAFSKGSYRLAVASMILLILWQLNSIVEAYHDKEREFIVAYQIKKCRAVTVKQKVRFVSDSIDNSGFKYHVRNHYISVNSPKRVLYDFNYVSDGKNDLLVLSTNSSAFHQSLPAVKTLIVSENYPLSAADIENLPSLEKIVVDGSNTAGNRRNIAKLCGKFGLACHLTPKDGAYLYEF